MGAPLDKSTRDLVMALVALLISIVAWHHYVMTPWTRDERIRVQVASVAPQVSGQITELRISDNQFVHNGEVLYCDRCSATQTCRSCPA